MTAFDLNPDILDDLRALDAAPPTEPTDIEWTRRQFQLLSIMGSNPQRIRRKKRAVITWSAFGAGVLLAGAAAFGAIASNPNLIPHLPVTSGGSLTSTQLASWVSVPTPLAASSTEARTAEQWCQTSVGNINGDKGAATISNLDTRGSVASLIYQHGSHDYYCLGSADNAGLWEVITPKPAAPVAADGILVDTSGSHGNGTAGMTFVVGYAGPNVTSITINEADGHHIGALVQNGRWTAWWPTPGTSAHGGPDHTVTITTRGGATRTVSADSIYPN